MVGRVTFSGLLSVMVECHDCGWVYDGKNGIGLAAQHSDRYGHWVTSDVHRSVAYGPEGHEQVERQLAVIRDREADQ